MEEQQAGSNGGLRLTDGEAAGVSPLIGDERAAARYRQIAIVERHLTIVNGQIATCKDHLKELRETKDGLLEQMRAAARDEGELPLTFDFEGPS